jgi:phage terminase large subunit-like protein
VPAAVDIALVPTEREQLKDVLRLRREQIEAELGSKRDWEPRPHQVPPEGVAGVDWFLWLMLGGRGAGKTDACAAYMNAHALGPPCLHGPVPHRMAIIAPTLGDASESCVNGPSGLRAHNPSVVEQSRKGGTFVTWPNGAQAKIFGAYTKQDPERLRAGGNRCMAWLEEIAAWRYLAECWKHTRLGLLRLGPHPHAIASTTPRNRPTVKSLIQMSTASSSLTRATTADNPHLPVQIREALYKEYGGTRLGQQELEGEMIDEVIGALWNNEQIEACRVAPQDAPAERLRMIIAVDPSWGTTNDEVGIVAGFLGPDNHAYVLEDLSAILAPAAWGEVVAHAYDRLQADRVIAEGNFQGEQVKLVMKAATVATEIQVNFALVHASRGKVLRAEPVVGLYEQGRVHHVGRMVGLEHQMTHWVPPRNVDEETGFDAGDPDRGVREEDPELEEGETSEEPIPSDYSPDRVDALVFLVTELLLGPGGPASIVTPPAKKRIGRLVQSPNATPATLSPHQRRLHDRSSRRTR